MPDDRFVQGIRDLQKQKRKAFKLDLAELHAICDANYARLLRLFPDYENCNTRDLLVGAAKIRLTVVERCRYTTIFQLHQLGFRTSKMLTISID